MCQRDHCDSRGRLFEEVFNDLNLCILNDGSSTYCHTASGTESILDLSVADHSLFLDLTWTVIDDLHGSDHFPKKPQVSDDGILEMLTAIFTPICVLVLLLKKPSSLGKVRLFSSPTCSPQLPPELFLKPSANPGCQRCLGSLTNENQRKEKSATSCFSATDIGKHS